MNDDEDMQLYWYEERGRYYIAWGDDDGPGLCLGEGGPGEAGDHAAATDAARRIGDPYKGQLGRLEWSSESTVRKALRAAKAAVEVWQAGVPLPDWAIKAQAEGWAPPKGWKPKPDDDLISNAATVIHSAHYQGAAAAWEAAGVLAAGGVPGEAMADMCRKNAQELLSNAGKPKG